MSDIKAEGVWTLTIDTPMGQMESKLVLENVGGALKGSQTADGDVTECEEIALAGNEISWFTKVSKPISMKLKFKGTINGDNIEGKVKALIGSSKFTGVRA